MDPRGGGGDEGDEEDRGVEGGETPSVLGGIAQLTIAQAPLEEDKVNLNAPLQHGALHITMVPQQESGLNLSALPQYNTLPPLQNASLNVNAQPFVPGEMKRCTYCLERWPASMFSKSQWNVRKTFLHFRRGGAFLISRLVGGPRLLRLREGGRKRKQENRVGARGAGLKTLTELVLRWCNGRNGHNGPQAWSTIAKAILRPSLGLHDSIRIHPSGGSMAAEAILTFKN